MSWELARLLAELHVAFNTKGYDMELGSKNLSIAKGFIGKTTNALS